MSKETITYEIRRELDKLNDRIDRKIVRGQRFDVEARRHKELLAALYRAEAESGTFLVKRKPLRFLKSPVRRSLDRGGFARLFNLRMA